MKNVVENLRSPGVLVVIFAILATAYLFGVKAPEAKKTLPYLKELSDSVPPPDNSVLLSDMSTYKSGQASVLRSYKTDLTWSQVQTHYDAQFVRLGWIVGKASTLSEWGTTALIYTKSYNLDKVSATVSYAGGGTHGWNIELEVAWR